VHGSNPEVQVSKLVSLRLEDELASWVEGYREARGWSRAELISTALRSFRADSEDGVPDLVSASPEVVPASSESTPVSRLSEEQLVRARHRQLAREMGWLG
jgi:metal-responsive CopG/Arc/MetJ family transcriptional regulator